MKKILIITTSNSSNDIDANERFRYVQEFCHEVEAQLKEGHVMFTTYEDIEVTVRSGNTTFFDRRNDLDLATVHFVHFKNWIYDTQIAGMLARYFETKKINFYNSEVAAAPSRTKITQMVLLARDGLPVPDTFFASNARFAEILANSDELPAGLTIPFILKSDTGAKGNDNYLIKDLDEARKIINQAPSDQQFVMQAYHPNDGDYRFLYIGLDESPIVFLRTASSTETHLNNTSKGGSGEFIDSKRIPSEYLRIAHRAAELTGREIGGVDILVNNKTSKPYILEVNQTPALATGYGVSEKIAKFVQLIAQDDKEEE